ncbi:hypothetical protein TcCL_NonESM11126, partial [Trypanosoma cruzi]
GAAAQGSRIELPRLRRAAVRNILGEHTPQRSRLAGDCATSVGSDGPGAVARRARPALTHRQRCLMQSRCRSGRRENGDGDGGPVLRSPLAGQRAAGRAGNSPCAACVLPVSVDASGVPLFPGTSQAAVGEGGIDNRSVQAEGSGCKMAQKLIQYADGSRGHARQTVADGRVRYTRREGPIHTSVTRGHASTRCADNSEDRSKCDADSVTDERVACCRGRAQTRSQEHRSTADPRGQERGAAMLRSTTGLGSREYQAVSHGPLAEWRKHRGGHDCGPPVCGAVQHGAGCLPVRKYARCMLSPQQTRPAPFRPSRFLWSVTTAARYSAFAHLQPCVHSGQRCSTRLDGSITVGFTQEKGDMFPLWQHACLSWDAVLRPCSVGWQMVVRVHVNGWTYSGRHAARVAHSHWETRRCGC